MKVRNKHIHSADQEWLITLYQEYKSLGHDCVLEVGHLTVLTRKRKAPRPERDDKKKSPRGRN